LTFQITLPRKGVTKEIRWLVIRMGDAGIRDNEIKVVEAELEEPPDRPAVVPKSPVGNAAPLQPAIEMQIREIEAIPRTARQTSLARYTVFSEVATSQPQKRNQST
jgi:hypothetical protein